MCSYFTFVAMADVMLLGASDNGYIANVALRATIDSTLLSKYQIVSRYMENKGQKKLRGAIHPSLKGQ